MKLEAFSVGLIGGIFLGAVGTILTLSFALGSFETRTYQSIFIELSSPLATICAGSMALLGAWWTVKKIQVQISQQNQELEQQQKTEKFRAMEIIVRDKSKMLLDLTKNDRNFISNKIIDLIAERQIKQKKYSFSKDDIQRVVIISVVSIILRTFGSQATAPV